jgi:hypothetical protein
LQGRRRRARLTSRQNASKAAKDRPANELLDPPAEFIKLILSDAVTTQDSWVQQRLANFAHKLWAGDQLERSILPQVEQS